MWKAMEERVSDEDINLAQLRLLLIIGHHDKPLTPAEIGQYVLRESHTVVVSLNHLVRNGYVEKMKDENDKRKVRIQITEKGKQRLEKHLNWVVAYKKEIITCFSKDEFQKFQENIKKLHEKVFQLFGIDLIAPLGGFIDTV
ncbi:MarR family winged helix-turn-helix transcriptional regulator [Chloroflexota bacterium]